MDVKTAAEVPAYVVSLTVGSEEGYGGRKISQDELESVIGEFQRYVKNPMAVSVSKTTILFNNVQTSYREECWKVEVISYPRFPQSNEEINGFMEDLAKFLIQVLKQNRITVCRPDKHILFEAVQ